MAQTGNRSGYTLTALGAMLSGLSIGPRATGLLRPARWQGPRRLDDRMGRAPRKESSQGALRVATANRPDGVVDEGAPC